MKGITYLLILALLISCGEKEETLFAYGSFETTEVKLSSQAMGEVLSISKDEGMSFKSGEILAQIDTVDLSLNKLQLSSQLSGLRAKAPDITIELDAIEQELSGLEKNQKRLENMLADGAATQKQLDDINTRIAVLKSRYKAKSNLLSDQNESLSFQIKALKEQIKLIDYRIAKSALQAPFQGTVIHKYAEVAEVVRPGQPVLLIADLDQMILKAYVNTEQLKDLNLNQNVKVYADYGDREQKAYTGRISWISSKAEFTPKSTRTQNERANLVYAIKIAVPNDGYLKIGMYGGFNLE